MEREIISTSSRQYWQRYH